MAELDAAGLLVTAQHPQPRKLTREDALCPQHLPYLKAVLKVCAGNHWPASAYECDMHATVGEHVNSSHAYRRMVQFSWTGLPAGRLASCGKAPPHE